MTQPLTHTEQAFALAFLDRPTLDIVDLTHVLKEATGHGNREAAGAVKTTLSRLRQKSGAALNRVPREGWRATPDDQAALRLALKASVPKAGKSPPRAAHS